MPVTRVISAIKTTDLTVDNNTTVTGDLTVGTNATVTGNIEAANVSFDGGTNILGKYTEYTIGARVQRIGYVFAFFRIYAVRIGRMVTLIFPELTSNFNGATYNAFVLPAELWPEVDTRFPFICTNNGNNAVGHVRVQANGFIVWRADSKDAYFSGTSTWYATTVTYMASPTA